MDQANPLSDAELEDITKKIAEAGEGGDADILLAVAKGVLTSHEGMRLMGRRERARRKAAKRPQPLRAFNSRPFGGGPFETRPEHKNDPGVVFNASWPKDPKDKVAMKKAQRRIRAVTT